MIRNVATHRHSFLRLSLILGLPLLLPLPSVHAQATLQLAGFSQALVGAGISNGTAMEIAPDGRIFVCQQGGALRVIKNDTLLATPFVTVPANAAGERGLLGIAFDPDYANNRFVYAYYTRVEAGIASNRVSRFTADLNNPDVAAPGSELEILRLENLSATNHNGGAIHFGPDGKLYVAVGENAVPSNAQSPNNRLGKILRINKDGSIPEDNPNTIAGILGSPTGLNRAIWAAGLRNPYTFAFQPGTGLMYINDVGQSLREEINIGGAGLNYGWPATEGSFNPSTFPNFTQPLFSYPHGGGNAAGFAISGGAFYNPQSVRTFDSGFVGDYFYADYINGWIRYLDAGTATSTLFATGASLPVDLKVGNDGALYYLSRGQGRVYRVTGEFNVALNAAPEPGTGCLLLAIAPVLAVRRRFTKRLRQA